MLAFGRRAKMAKIPKGAGALTSREFDQRLRSLTNVTTDEVRALRQEITKEVAALSATEILQIAYQLLKTPGHIHRFVAYELIHFHPEALASLDAAMLDKLQSNLNDWAGVDTYSSYLLGPAWRESQVPDSYIIQFTKSKDRWLRRAAVVATVPLNNKTRGGSGDTKRTLLICEMLINDRDDMVVKALSWALRELAKRDSKAVEQFLQIHQPSLAPRVIREVRNKLSTGLKSGRARTVEE
ncbi:MAG: DNA alkylation repair protein [Planctomycetota bacterium]